MDLFPPKRRYLELWLLSDSEIKMVPKTVWEIDVPFSNSFLWSFTLCYLTSSHENRKFWASLVKLHADNEFPPNSKHKHMIHKIEKVISKFNPFKNYHFIYWDRFMKIFVFYFEKILKLAGGRISSLPENICENCLFLTKAAKTLGCVIHVYKTTASGNHRLYSFYPEENSSEHKFVRLILFQHISREENTLVNDSKENEKFGFAISLNYSRFLRENALVHILKRANLSGNEIRQTREAVKNQKSFLVGLLKSSKTEIISKLYKSPYIIRKLTEAGFEADPKSEDENGLSSFYHCMGLADPRLLRILYHFSTKSVMMIDNTIGDPCKILKALDKTANVIRKDWTVSNGYFSLLDKKIIAFRRCLGILRFNDFQSKVVKAIFQVKKNIPNAAQQKSIMISILEKYNEYYSFFYTPLVTDTFGLFQDFLRHNEYYQDLDSFICLLFFHSMPSLIIEGNRNIFSNAIYSLFLNILSDRFFPKYDINCDCCSSRFGEENCKHKHNSHRFIVFNYRRCFLESAEALVSELRNPLNIVRSSAEPLLEEIKASLISLPEIEDEFLMYRLKRHLDTVSELTPESSASKGILIIERTMQVIGETLQNKTISNTFVKFLLHVLIPPKLEHQFCIIRDHSLGHYRSSSVQGRLKMESNNTRFLKGIQGELETIGMILQPIYVSQYLRVEEFMIKTGEKEAERNCKAVNSKINLQLREITNKRKQLFFKHRHSLIYLLCKTFKFFQDKLNKDDAEFSQDFKCELQAFEFLVTLISKHCSDCFPNVLTNLIAELNNFILSFDHIKTCEEKKEMLKVVLSKPSRSLRSLLVIMDALDLEHSFPYLSSAFVKLKDSKIFNPKEKEEIKKKILEYFGESAESLQKIKQELIKGFIPEDLKDKLEIIIITEKKKKSVIECIPQNIKKASKCLKSVREDNVDSLFKAEESNMFVGMLEREELISALLRINFRPKLKNKIIQVINQKLRFLIDRITRLKKILIFEDENICFLWNSRRWERNPEIEKRTKYLMIQRYLTEKDLRSSLEMLLFDCMNVLENPKLIDIWKKANYMFIGANMVQFLAHGNPVMESINALLYPEDLPSEIINEIFQLINDEISLRSLGELWEKVKVGNVTTFENIVKETKKDKWSGLRKRIMCCERWKLYMKILPLRGKENDETV
ncbi:unnamed protein product [Larinioides sclopetarius]|uniref:Uncharacterized protein n=1 Tax=Larinioides sclopetarius TaxID=280406 RepID=A0AAV2BE93_9ARAC